MIRSRRNAAAPINRFPPEILASLPDFFGPNYPNGDQDVIALTHVCQAWRLVFVSRSALWADIECENTDKTLVYLERSRSFPVNLSLHRNHNLSPHDYFIQSIPRVIGRLKSIYIHGTPENLQGIADHLTHPAPTLHDVSIIGGCDIGPEDIPVLTSALFGGDLSSLRKLSLEHVRTELHWRNMVRLTSLRLLNTSPVSMRQLLDFLESAPHLREVELCFETPTTGTQNGRLVSLACLKSMRIWGRPSPVLLDHLLIPVGADLTVTVDFPSSTGRPFRFLENLQNLHDFTTIELFSGSNPRMQFSGPNGEICMIPENSHGDEIRLMLKSLSQFDTSKTERLEIDFGVYPSSYPLHLVLLPMENLRTFKVSRCPIPRTLVDTLNPNKSSSRVVICPKLEDLVIEYKGTLDTNELTGMTAARESRGAKLNPVVCSQLPPPTPCRTPSARSMCFEMLRRGLR